MKYYNYGVTFSEIPDEITLIINITNCPFKCEECHSPHLREDIGGELTLAVLNDLVEKEDGVSCIVFMGGDHGNNLISLWDVSKEFKIQHPNIKTAWYSGWEFHPNIFNDNKTFDYIKVGPYKKELGALDSPTTNQRLYQWGGDKDRWIDITYKFWKKW